MIDSNIPLSIKTIALPDYFGERRKVLDDRQTADARAQQISAAKMQNQEQQRQLSGAQAARGLMDVNDISTPEGQGQYVKDLTKLGYGDQALDAQGKFSSLAANATTAQEKAQDLLAKKRDYAQKIYDAGNQYVSTVSAHIKTLPNEQRKAAQDQAVQEMLGLHLNPHEFASASMDDRTLTQYERIGMKPEDRAKLEHDERAYGADDAFRAELPGLQAQLKGIGADATKRNSLVADIYTKFGASPMAQKFVDDIKNNSQSFTINANQSKPEDIDFYAGQLADGKMTPAMVDKMFSSRGGNKAAVMSKILRGAEEKNPQFNSAQASIDIKQAQDVTNNRTIALIDAAIPNFARLKTLSDKISRLPIKTVTHAALAASRQFNDEDLALFDTMKILQTDEINQIFAGGKGGSDMSRKMASDLINETLPPKAFRKAIDVVYETMQNKRKAIKGTMGMYGKDRQGNSETGEPVSSNPSAKTVVGPNASPVKTSNGKTYLIEAE